MSEVQEAPVKKSSMVWSGEKDLIMLREIAAEGVMHQKPNSRGRGSAWQKVVDHLNPAPGFDVNSRSIRDRFKTLARKHKIKMAKEDRATGGGGEDLTETERILEELMEVGEETELRLEEEGAAKQQHLDDDREKAMEMRKRSMETMGETRERLGEGSKEEKRRRSASQSMDWLDKAIKAKQDMAEKEYERRAEDQRQNTLMMQQMFANQQQKSQQFVMMQNAMMQMMEQQQKQSDMLLELFRNLQK